MEDNDYLRRFRSPAESNSQQTGGKVLSLKKPYLAIDRHIASTRLPRIRINYSNGDISLMSYGYLQEVISVSPEFIALIFTTGGVTLKGQNLRGLLDILQTEDVKAVHPFNPAIHEEPEAGAPKIELIEFRRVMDVREE